MESENSPQPLEKPLIPQSPPNPPQTLEIEQINEKIEQPQETKQEDLTVPSIPSNLPKKPLTKSQFQKIRILAQKFNPIPFLPPKNQSFSSHESVFRALNLWEFLNHDFSFDIRSDLLVELIGTYDSTNYCSYVRSHEIRVGKLELARALSIPVEKNETCEGIFENDEAKDVILKFMSGFVLLEDEDEDEMCILPEEAVEAINLVRNGRANDVDWSGLMWVLVEKDMLDALRLGSCKFASHVQCLIKVQCPGLFEEGLVVLGPESDWNDVSDSVEEEEYEEEEEFDEEETEDGDDQGPGLSLGKNESVDLMNEMNWNEEGKSIGSEHWLRRCNSSDMRSMEFENLCKKENMLGRDDEFSNLERMNSTDFLHSMDGGRVSYSPRMNLMEQNIGPSGSNFYDTNVNGKRQVDDVDSDDQYHQSNQQKRMKFDSRWEEQQAPSGFDSYMDQIQSAIEKAKMLYVEKEQACLNAHLQLQCLNEMLVQKDEIIRNLERTQAEEHQTWELTVNKYRNELNILANLVLGYKKALKATQNSFDEYRKKYPEGDEPLYKDADGPGGLVVTSKEYEKMKFEREEEMKQIAEELITTFSCQWLVKFEEYDELLVMVNMKLSDLEEEVQLVKERFAECKSKVD